MINIELFQICLLFLSIFRTKINLLRWVKIFMLYIFKYWQILNSKLFLYKTTGNFTKVWFWKSNSGYFLIFWKFPSLSKYFLWGAFPTFSIFKLQKLINFRQISPDDDCILNTVESLLFFWFNIILASWPMHKMFVPGLWSGSEGGLKK